MPPKVFVVVQILLSDTSEGATNLLSHDPSAYRNPKTAEAASGEGIAGRRAARIERAIIRCVDQETFGVNNSHDVV